MGKNLGLILVVIILAGIGFYYLKNQTSPQKTSLSETQQSANTTPLQSSNPEIPSETIIAEGLDTPWAIAFLPAHSASSAADAGGPDGGILVTERPGRVRLVDTNGKLQEKPVATIAGAKEIGEGGLLGIALHPNFSSNNYVYFYYTYGSEGDNTRNRVVRMTYENGQLSDEKIIVDNIPGASNHNGGRIKFGPDNYLYITTGDAQEPSLAQQKSSLAGKILRVTDEGKPTPGNFNDTYGYSWGHRNPQGIAWDSNGNLWETEHGPSGGSLGTGNDEVNLIEFSKNYGWPIIQGNQIREGMVTPVKNSTPSVAWAPGGAAFIGNSFFFGGLRGQALYEAVIQNNQITEFTEHFKNKYGRIREVIAGPDGMLYISTSNQDGRGRPAESDDRIIKINPEKL